MRTTTNIYRRQNGTWEGRYKNGYNLNGKVNYSSVYGKTYSECKEKLEKAKNSIITTSDTSDLTINDLYILYDKTIKKISTRSTYKRLYDKHLRKPLGGLKVVKINNETINTLLLKTLESHSDGYTLCIRTFILSMMNYALKSQLTANKIEAVLKINPKINKIDIFNETEQATLENYLISNINLVNVAILLALYTGVRIGELCALNVYDIDLENEYININKTMQRIKNLEENPKTKTKIIIDTPKSQKSVREIPIPKFLVDLLIPLIKGVNKNSFLLTGTIQKFVEPRALENKYKIILEHCNIEYRKFHTLRHTFATNCITKRFYDYKTLSDILGHSSPSITLGIYVHSNKHIKSEQVKNIDKDFNSRKISCK